MAYLLILIALLCLTVKGVCGKKVGSLMRDTGDAFLFNLLRMLFCLLIGFFIVLMENAQGSLAVGTVMFLVCLLSGAANALFLVAWILAIRRNAMVTVDVALTIGSLLPAVLCAILFGEEISVGKIVGYALILLATAILSGYNKSTMGNPGFLGVLFVVAAALGDGLSGFAQQLYKQFFCLEEGLFFMGKTYPLSVFHFYTYVFAALILLAFFVGYQLFARRNLKKEDGAQAEKTSIIKRLAKPLPVIFIMAVCLFAANWLQTMATNQYAMPSQILYPLIKGGCLITVNITAMTFFGEPITRRSVCGSLTALLGIVAMSLF